MVVPPLLLNTTLPLASSTGTRPLIHDASSPAVML
jgi:hypothetical protein